MDASFVSKVKDYMALHEAMKTADFTTFLELLQKATPPPPPPTNSIWGMNFSSSAPNPGVRLLSMIKAPSPPESVCDEEDFEPFPVPPLSTKKNRDTELHFIMCYLKMVKMSSLMVFLKHHFLQYPDCFQLTKDGHFSTGETTPHMTLQYIHPGGIPNMVTGKKHKEWSSTLHIYYKVTSSGKKIFTHITGAVDGEIQIVAVCPDE